MAKALRGGVGSKAKQYEPRKRTPGTGYPDKVETEARARVAAADKRDEQIRKETNGRFSLKRNADGSISKHPATTAHKTTNRADTLKDNPYSPDRDAASWVLDLAAIRMADPIWSGGLNWSPPNGVDVAAAQRRMARYGQHLRAHLQNGPGDPVGDRVLRARQTQLTGQGYLKHDVERLMHDFRRQALGMSETRDSSTSAASLGALTPTVYYLEQYALYRTNAAPVLAAAKKAPLPPTGMEVDIPLISAPLGAKDQGSDNTNATGSDPSATFSKAPVKTFVSGSLVSQQVIDRTGPGVSYDQVHAAQAAREIGTQFETEVLAAVVAAAQTVTDSASAGYQISKLWDDVAEAASLTLGTAGTALQSTHIYGPEGCKHRNRPLGSTVAHLPRSPSGLAGHLFACPVGL